MDSRNVRLILAVVATVAAVAIVIAWVFTRIDYDLLAAVFFLAAAAMGFAGARRPNRSPRP